MIIAALLIAAVVAYSAVKHLRTPKPYAVAPPAHFETVQDEVNWLADEAVDIARNEGVNGLDYSLGSILHVERLLAKLHDDYARAPSKNGFGGLATAFGAYVGECIRRSSPGAHWELNHPVQGERTFPLHWEGGESFPLMWCYKRIINGDEDNVWIKYQIIVQSRKHPGSQPLNEHLQGSD